MHREVTMVECDGCHTTVEVADFKRDGVPKGWATIRVEFYYAAVEEGEKTFEVHSAHCAEVVFQKLMRDQVFVSPEGPPLSAKATTTAVSWSANTAGQERAVG